MTDFFAKILSSAPGPNVLQYVRDYMRHQCLTRLRSSYICIVLQRCMLLNG